MITKELVDYISKQLSAGMSKDQIAASLGGGDWSPGDIAEAFTTLEPKVTPPVPVVSIPVVAPAPVIAPVPVVAPAPNPIIAPATPIMTPITAPAPMPATPAPFTPAAQTAQAVPVSPVAPAALNASIPPIVPTPQRRSNKKLLIFIALFILIAAGAAGAYLFYGKALQKILFPAVEQAMPAEPIPLPVVEDVQVQPEPPKPSIMSYVKVPVEENNASDFNAIDVSIVKNEDRDALSKYVADPASTSTISSADSQKMIDTYSGILKTFDDAMMKKYYQCSIATESCSYNTLRIAANLALLKAISLQDQGKHAEAIVYINNVIALGKEITAEADSDIEILVGWQIQRDGYRWFSKIGGLASSTDEIKASVAALRSEHKNVLNFNYTRAVETVDYITSKDNKLSFTFSAGSVEDKYIEGLKKSATTTTWKPEETKDRFFVSMQKELAYTDLPCESPHEYSKTDTEFNIKDTTPVGQDNFVESPFYISSYTSLREMNTKRCDVEKALGAL